MHDAPLNQAAGLLGLAPQNGAQLIAMTSHGDDRSELPLLWQLCTAMVELGYAVTVLDATKSESAANPGLNQLLEYRYGYGAPESDTPEWNVVPSAQGLHNLCNLRPNQPANRAHNLRRIGELFPSNGVIILYAGVDWLVKLLGGTATRPLLTVSEEKSSLLTSYLALKRLLLKGALEPTILNMMHQGGKLAHSGSVSSNLTECARNFLNYDVNAIQYDLSQTPARADAEMRRLATRLLESALTLNAGSQLHSMSNHHGIGVSGRSH